MSHYFRTFALILVSLCGNSAFVHGQTFDTQFVLVQNNGSLYQVKVQIKSNTSTFALGSSNLAFSFNTSSLSNPTLITAHNFSGGNYVAMNISNVPSQVVSINIELALSPGTTVPLTYIDVATIQFTTTNPSGSSNLTWIATEPTVVFKDDESTIVPVGTLNNLNTTPLPIQLASFTASASGQNRVQLDWSTVSELNNYGFEVQKSAGGTGSYATIPGSFVPGHGTTLVPQYYSYTDTTAQPGLWYYRLKQIDLDGTLHYTEGVSVHVVTSVDEVVPKVFALHQNYPNPFNPTTEIKFSVERNARTSLELYNILGERVAVLFDAPAEAGKYYAVTLAANDLPSGVYLYRLQSGEKSTVRRMLLVK